MFKRIRSKLPDWRFIGYVLANSIPGKKLLGDWRFPPFFFVAGVAFEVVLCKLRINNVNFCEKISVTTSALFERNDLFILNFIQL